MLPASAPRVCRRWRSGRFLLSFEVCLLPPAVDLSIKTFPSTDPEYRLDYIFHNDTFIELQSSEIVNPAGEIAGHLPVMMTFKLKFNLP